MGRPKKGTSPIIPSCHPELEHQAKGLCNSCYQKQYRVSKPVCLKYTREKHLKRKYGISLNDFNTILKEQGGHCKLCTMIPDVKFKNFCVDHHHISGKIRGILCKFCNSKLGWYENRKQAIETYLT